MIRNEHVLHEFAQRCDAGERVIAIRRLFYALDGSIDRREGPIEISLEDSTFFFESGADGEALAVDSGVWEDPFSGELSDENRAFVDDHGKWIALDIIEGDPEFFLVGETIDRVLPIVTNNAIVGAGLVAGSKMLVIRLAFDETFVEVTDKD
ncbi:hypothetical protein DFR67_1047 [Williamsia limnetica]|uniref:DUF1851 domain-containing protein n=1 Tax=Williamsia limnetica TaxID=882452 RepID=A0A318RK45_WILLI|nr:hypothetical protein [Williamsia limnetica]PYE18429.1 hypothetical protein DFR67_1047 [Williamsia limnetica]